MTVVNHLVCQYDLKRNAIYIFGFSKTGSLYSLTE